MEQIIMQPIGIIYSPYKQNKDIPIQGIFKGDVDSTFAIFEVAEE